MQYKIIENLGMNKKVGYKINYDNCKKSYNSYFLYTPINNDQKHTNK